LVDEIGVLHETQSGPTLPTSTVVENVAAPATLVLNVPASDQNVFDAEASPSALTIAPKQKLKSVIVCPNLGLNLDLNKVRFYIPKTLPCSFLSFLSTLDISRDTDIPLFFDDPFILVYLGCLMPPQITDVTPDEALEMMIADEIPEKKEQYMVEIPRPLDFTPTKRRAKKLVEPLDVQFLRRSKRNADKLGGFRDEESARKAAKSTMDPMPLAIVPLGSPALAPYLTLEVIEGIVTGFL